MDDDDDTPYKNELIWKVETEWTIFLTVSWFLRMSLDYDGRVDLKKNPAILPFFHFVLFLSR